MAVMCSALSANRRIALPAEDRYTLKPSLSPARGRTGGGHVLGFVGQQAQRLAGAGGHLRGQARAVAHRLQLLVQPPGHTAKLLTLASDGHLPGQVHAVAHRLQLLMQPPSHTAKPLHPAPGHPHPVSPHANLIHQQMPGKADWEHSAIRANRRRGRRARLPAKALSRQRYGGSRHAVMNSS